MIYKVTTANRAFPDRWSLSSVASKFDPLLGDTHFAQLGIWLQYSESPTQTQITDTLLQVV